MKSSDKKVPDPPLPTDNIHHDEENEKCVQNMTTKLMTPISNLKLAHKKPPSQLKKSEIDTSITIPVTVKTPFPENENEKEVDITQKTIEVANAVIVNTNRITTLVTFQFRPPINGSNVSVSRSHQNIFEVLKLLDSILKFVTFHQTHIDTIE